MFAVGSPVVRRSLGQFVDGWVGGCRGRWGHEMGIGGELLPHMSGLGVLLKNPQV
jgi:hypothetical protein